MDTVQDARTAEKRLEKMCEMCGKPFTPHKLAPWAKYCKDPECVKHRHVVRQMEFYRRRPNYTGNVGRPQTIPPEARSVELRCYYRKKGEVIPIRKRGRKNGVAPDKRSPQLEYYYKKKAGKVDGLEDKLKAI